MTTTHRPDMKTEANPSPTQRPADDYSTMLARLVHALQKGAPTTDLIDKADALLKRTKFSPFREESSKGGAFDYLVSYGGGIGPDVWDSEMELDGDNIVDAATRAHARAEEIGGWVFTISQEDYPPTTRERLESDYARLAALNAELLAALEAILATPDPYDATGNEHDTRRIMQAREQARAALARAGGAQ